METAFRNEIKKPLVSLILLDWSCRESFHSLRYLNQQTVARDTYEILWIEYYSRKAPQIASEIKEDEEKRKPPVIDQWIILGMPDNVCYHKHLMYNVGIVKSKGDIIVICDSDAIFPPTFVATIIESFKNNEHIVLHLDEVRNNNKKFYPFSYPTIEEVLGEGCVNWKDGKTTGLWDKRGFIHTRNYGACMAAKRDDLIAIGGADEHFDYVGHVCGPYEMTFRMINAGIRELWHQTEFIYHTWHSGQAGDKNYVGPHDGRLISTTAIGALGSGRISPLVENEAIKILRKGEKYTEYMLQEKLVDKSYAERLNFNKIEKEGNIRVWYNHDYITSYKECNIVKYCDKFYGVPKFLKFNDLSKEDDNPVIVMADTLEAVIKKLDKHDSLWFSPRIVESYMDFNIVRYGNRIYGIPQTFGGFDLPNAEERRSIAHLSGETVGCVKKIINKIDRSAYFPVMVNMHRGYNIVKYQGKLYCMKTNLGHVDFTQKVQVMSSDILSADTQEEIESLINKKLSESEKVVDNFNMVPQKNIPMQFEKDEAASRKELYIKDIKPIADDISYLLYVYKGYNIIRHNDGYYALPHSAGPIDLRDDKQRSHPEIISADNCSELHARINQLEKTVPIEYAGWLPSFRNFGDCGNHPQFSNINNPPTGYRFTYSKPNHGKLSVKKRLCRYMALSLTGIFIVTAALKFAALAWLKGAKLGDIRRFFRTRGLKSQLLLKSRKNLVFLTSVPYTFGQYPWVIELEDPISFLFPFFHNGETLLTNFQKSPYFPVFKTLIESKQCRGIVTHIKSTADNLSRLFNSEKISSKITYMPLGIKMPTVFHVVQKEKKEVHLLFNNSWHQDPRSFFLRGGLDVLSAFEKLRERYKNVYLTLRSSLPLHDSEYLRVAKNNNLPALDSEYLNIIKNNKVRVIKQFLTKSDWEMLMKESDIYLLPSDRIHVVSVLEAMSYGLPVVVSDGWGFEEYIHDRINGMIVKGRYGRVTWMDNETGMLRENYSLMSYQDPVIVKGLVEAVTSLIEDKDLYEKISRKAREDIATKYNLENWNNGLKQAFDKALNRGVRG